MGILSRKMAMPAQIPANPIHYKEVLNPKAIDPKKYEVISIMKIDYSQNLTYSIQFLEEKVILWRNSSMIVSQTLQI